MAQKFGKLLENALLGTPVAVKTCTKFGRCLVAARKIRAGETVLREDPWYSSDVSENEEIAEKLSLDAIPGLNEGHDNKAAVSLVGQVLLKRHPAFNDDYESVEEWPEMGLGHSYQIIDEVKDSDTLRTAFVLFSEQFQLRNNEFWSKKLFNELCAKYLTNCMQKHDSPLSDLYVAKSIFNHACGSNCMVWPESGDIFAEIDIEEGEQLFINYGSECLVNRDISCMRDETCLCHTGGDILRNENQLKQIQILSKIRRDSFKSAGIRVQDGHDELWYRLEKAPDHVREQFFALLSGLFEDLDWEVYNELTDDTISVMLHSMPPEEFLKTDIGKMATIRPIAMTAYLNVLGINAKEVAQKMANS